MYLVSLGGKGTCGKCKVRILEGGFRTLSTAKLQPGEIDKGMVLACQTRADEDITVDIPKESKLVVGDVIEIARSQDLFGLFISSDGKISPIVRWIELDLPLPTLDNNISDLERLKNAVFETGVKGLGFSHSFVSSLPHALRDAGWKVKLGHTRESDACFLKPVHRTGQYGIAVEHRHNDVGRIPCQP